MWNVIFEQRDQRIVTRATRSRDLAIQAAYELMHQSYTVRRIIVPNGTTIERGELEDRYDAGRSTGFG